MDRKGLRRSVIQKGSGKKHMYQTLACSHTQASAYGSLWHPVPTLAPVQGVESPESANMKHLMINSHDSCKPLQTS